MKRRYEFVFLTASSLKEEEEKKTLEKLADQLKKTGAKIEKKEDLGERELAYPIAKSKKAHFWVWWLSLGQAVDFSPVLTHLSRQKEIIRYLFLRTEEA